MKGNKRGRREGRKEGSKEREGSKEGQSVSLLICYPLQNYVMFVGPATMTLHVVSFDGFREEDFPFVVGIYQSIFRVYVLWEVPRAVPF